MTKIMIAIPCLAKIDIPRWRVAKQEIRELIAQHTPVPDPTTAD